MVYRAPPAVRHFQRGALIGRGSSGTVYEALDLDRGCLIAVKEIEFPEDLAEDEGWVQRLREVMSEVRLMADLPRHEHIVQFYGVTREDFKVHVLMEHVSGGSLRSLLLKYGPLPERVAIAYTHQVLEALTFLHSQGIVHRDIKGANVLVTTAGVIKLSDFGAAKIVRGCDGNLPTSLHGTPYWMAPEVVRQAGHGAPSDVWSVGATVLEMLTGHAPFHDLSPAAAFLKIGHCQTEVPLPGTVPGRARGFLRRCFVRDPTCRATPSELLRHPWLVLSE